MKATLALLVLSLSPMAWAKDPLPLPKGKDGQMSKDTAQCLERCQAPIVRCMGRCKGDATCTADCHPEDMQQCAEKCGMVKKKNK